MPQATGPLFLGGHKHIAEGAGFESNPSWLPTHKRETLADPLLSAKNTCNFRATVSG
jgi:hypothetical protein